jgi:MFS transporter, DHA3 family, macrolide efflux protein
VLVIDCLTFALAAVTTLWVKKSLSKPTEKTAQDSFWRDFVSGFQYTYQHTSLFVLLLVASLITLFVGTLQALLGPMILSFASAKVFGISQTMATTGMLVSSLLIGLFSRSDKKVRLLAYGLFAAGLLFSLIGISPNIIIITLFAFLFFLALPIVNTSLDVLVRRNVADHMQARVWSIVSLISQSGMIVAFAGAGYLADHWFNPWLLKGGYFSSSIGDVIGVGPGRGIGLLYIISGLLLSATGILVANLKILTKLEVENHE